MDKDYKGFYYKFVDYESKLHEHNQRKIQVGLKINIFLPLIFLFLCFLVPGSEFLFLMLWIISLFGIAVYLISVEYRDYQMLNRMKEFGAVSKEYDRNLMGGSVEAMEQMEQVVDERIDAIEGRIDERKARLEKEIARLNKERDVAEQARKNKKQEISDKMGGRRK